MSLPPLRAPGEHRGVLAAPSLGDVARLLEENRRRLEQPITILGQSLRDLRQRARAEILAAARAYLTERGEPAPRAQEGPLLLAGHQPELFHPGVWVKNFALAGLARVHRGNALNLVVDNDIAKSLALHLPVDDRLASVPIDLIKSEVPYEERGVLDAGLFKSVVERALPLTSDWPFEPLLREFWPNVLRSPGTAVGEKFVAARRVWEHRWGCHNFELPLSRLCQTETFAWFACHLLQNLPRFHTLYNEAVQSYRHEHGLRSRNHPVPDLAHDGVWLETPLWHWRTDQPARGRVFAQVNHGKVVLRLDGTTLDLGDVAGSPTSALERWTAAGWKIRTRALTTTLLGRLFVGDLFMHGIGGGKYDELTDRIAERFYGLEPPSFVVLSATLWLPLPQLPVSEADVRRLECLHRDIWWNPERHIQEIPGQKLRVRRQEVLERDCSTRRERRERYRELRHMTEDLRADVAQLHDDVGRRLDDSRRAVAINRLRRRRDYSFCLYPEEELKGFFERFL